MRAAIGLGFAFLAGTACTGSIELPRGSGAPEQGSGGASGTMGSAGSGGSTSNPGDPVDIGDIVGVDPETLPDGVAPNSRVLRLGYGDYDRTLSDLLHLALTPSSNFPEEQPNLGPYDGLGERSVNERLLTEFVRAAQSFSEEVVATPAVYAELVGCDPAASGCRDEFIDGFGLRTFRRPLEPSEQTRYRTLFDSAAASIQSGDPFRDGVALVIEAILQSPKFLYRIEAGAGTTDANGPVLTDHEVASRLSYMLWGTMPDDALFAAAAGGALSSPAAIAEQAQRLSSDPRFTGRALEFHERWMQLDELNSLAKDPETYPQFSNDLLASMRAETRRFIEEVTLTRGGTVTALLTAPFGYADSALAGVYGFNGSFGSTLTEVGHDASSPRIGLFTQASFLAGHSSSSTGTSPILRGVFLLRRLACATIPDPPAGAQMQEPDQQPAEEIVTTRQYFTWKTSMPACASCHAVVNPTGFAFEQFDGIGQLRATENGAAIDSTGSLRMGMDDIEFNGARQLLEALAARDEVRACYAKNWLQYAYGREETQSDSRAIGLLARDMENAAFTLRDLAVSLTARPAFNHLPPLAE